MRLGRSAATLLAVTGGIALASWVVLVSAQHSIFSDASILTLRIEAPLQELFTTGRDNVDYSVQGTLIDTASGARRPLPIALSLRGHTSRRESECSFPKLKVDLKGIDRGELDRSTFRGLKTLKIGTHCGEARDDTPTRRFGRLPNERSPFREVTVYRLLEALEVPALQARAARIEYVDTSNASPQDSGSQPVVRNALLLEDDDAAIARFGGKGEIEPANFTTADRTFSTADATGVAFAEALLGNFDWCVRWYDGDTYRCDARQILWNVTAAKTGGGKARPILYDFDVSGMVAGTHRWFGDVFNESFARSKSHREVEVIAQLQRTRSLFARRSLDEARQRFIAKKPQVYRVLDARELDADGRRQMREYADAFFREIESDDLFYRPVVVAENTIPRGAPGPNATPVCTSRGAIPVGTPVSEPLEERDGTIKVVLLDALWHWGPSSRCAPVQSGTVWIDAKSVGREYPRK